MQVQLRLAEAQQLNDAITDPLLRPALLAFLEQQKAEYVELLLSAVRQSVRDNQKESRLAGRVETYENFLGDLQRFAKDQLRNVTQ